MVTSVDAAEGRLVAGLSDGVLVFDAVSAQAPRLVGAHSGSYAAREVIIASPERVYVAADADGLLSLGLADPARPVLRADWRPPFSVSAVGLDGRGGDPARGGHVFAAAAGVAVVLDLLAAGTPTPAPTETGTPTATATPGWTATVFAPALVHGSAQLR